MFVCYHHPHDGTPHNKLLVFKMLIFNYRNFTSFLLLISVGSRDAHRRAFCLKQKTNWGKRKGKCEDERDKKLSGESLIASGNGAFWRAGFRFLRMGKCSPARFYSILIRGPHCCWRCESWWWWRESSHDKSSPIEWAWGWHLRSERCDCEMWTLRLMIWVEVAKVFIA